MGQQSQAIDLWVVIPAFNEGPVIGEVVTAVRALYHNVVVVDDCSGDDTGTQALEAGATVLRHPINLGPGAAWPPGIHYALSRGTGYIVKFDADGQHRPEDIGVLLDTQLKTGADVVLGSRFLGHAENIPRLRRVLRKLAIVYTNITSGVKLTDAHNGLRLLTRRAAERLRIRQDRMGHASGIIDQIGRWGRA